jgi:3',5'-cyclic AMP phosphodiesterase CpdA
VRTLLHLSDIHFGRFEEVLRLPLLEAAAQLKPDLVVVSGDLTQRARPEQFQQAREFLDQLPRPLIVVPGNHDVPVYRPLRDYRRYITEDLHPAFGDDEIAALGINTARGWIWKNGRVDRRQLERIRQHFRHVPRGVAKILVTHHPFDLPAHYGKRDLVVRAAGALRTVAECGIDLLLAGHFHVAHAGQTTGGRAAIFVAAGTLSGRLRGEANSFNAIRIAWPEIEIDHYCWNGAEFVRRETQRFALGGGGWLAVKS